MCHCFRMIDVDLLASSWLASRRRMKVLMIKFDFCMARDLDRIFWKELLPEKQLFSLYARHSHLWLPVHYGRNKQTKKYFFL